MLQDERLLHSYLCELPKSSCNRHKVGDHFDDIIRKATFFTEVAQTDHRENLVNGRVRWKGAVENGKLALQTLRDVITTTSWLYHGSQKLHVHNGGKISRFLQAVKAAIFHQLPHNLVGNLVTPFIYHWHVDVINEDRGSLSSRWTICCPNSFVYVAFNGTLLRMM